MSEELKHIIDYLPFVSLATGHPSSQTPLVTRFIETAIMAAVSGAFATYIGVELLRQDVTTLKEGIAKVDSKVEKLDEKIEKVRSDLYIPRGK